MIARSPFVVRLISDVLRTARRIVRQTERRQRYRRLGWV